MKEIIKRNGNVVPFNEKKIENAILKAFKEVDGEITEYAKETAKDIATNIKNQDETLSVEQIQDKVIYLLMNAKKEVAKAYIEYRFKRQLIRESKKNSTDKTILEIVDGESEYWNSENSNKNPKLNSTVRDYIAGATSTDVSRRLLLPDSVVEAHDKGIIHFHESNRGLAM